MRRLSVYACLKLPSFSVTSNRIALVFKSFVLGSNRSHHIAFVFKHVHACLAFVFKHVHACLALVFRHAAQMVATKLDERIRTHLKVPRGGLFSSDTLLASGRFALARVARSLARLVERGRYVRFSLARLVERRPF